MLFSMLAPYHALRGTEQREKWAEAQREQLAPEATSPHPRWLTVSAMLRRIAGIQIPRLGPRVSISTATPVASEPLYRDFVDA